MTNARHNKAKIIRILNEKLKTISIKEVATRLGRTHQSLYYHLNPNRPELADLALLKQIIRTIRTIEEEEAEEAKKILQSINA